MPAITSLAAGTPSFAIQYPAPTSAVAPTSDSTAVSAAPSPTLTLSAIPDRIRIVAAPLADVPPSSSIRTVDTYIVAEGDTLSGIGQRLGLTVEALLATNPQISDRSLVHPGDRLTVPAVIHDLGTLAGTMSYATVEGMTGGTRSGATAINDRGEVVGWSSLNYFYRYDAGYFWTPYHGFVWRDGLLTDLGTLGGEESWASDVNDEGVIVGQSSVSANGPSRAFRWQDGVMTDLGTLGGPSSAASAINDLGQVVGESQTTSGDRHAFLWQDGVMSDLGTLGGPSSAAGAINDLGQVVGESLTATGQKHAFLWQDGVMTDLGTLGGVRSSASGINNKGQVVGSTTIPGSVGGRPFHAFLWQDGVMADLGTLGGVVSSAAAIDDRGEVVGRSATGHGFYDAVLWRDGLMIDLGRPGSPWAARDCGATGVNDLNQIVGSCEPSASGSDPRAFLHEAASPTAD